MTEPTRASVERLRSILARRLGLEVPPDRTADLMRVLDSVRSQRTEAVDGWLDALEAGKPDALAAAARVVTVGETYFFRDPAQIRAFVDVAVPAVQRERPLRVLSAGCASGEEPYTLAIALREAGLDPGRDARITGIDANPAALEKAAVARYGDWALRATPASVVATWFRRDRDGWALVETARRGVDLAWSNLAEDDAIWSPGTWDVVFCRNVLMYFTTDAARDVLSRIHRALVPGGYLFLGHAESPRGLVAGFELQHTHGTFYHRRQVQRGAHAAPAWRAAGSEDPPTAAPAEDGWPASIDTASARIRALSLAVPAPPEPRAVPAWDAAAALDDIRHERFGAALVALDACPPPIARRPDVLLLRAVVLAHLDRLEEARETCHRLLLAEPEGAGAHHVLALCAERAGDAALAVRHDRQALSRDPRFAMARLHLGLLARRGGQQQAARTELLAALAAIDAEPPARIALFGGGFSREALASLCRSELRALGGAA